MKRVAQGRDRIIDYIGAHGGMPALDAATGEPAILRPGEDESALRRVAWPEFFRALEERGYALVYEDSPGSFEHRFAPRREALAEAHGRGSGLKTALEMLKGLPVPAGHP